MNLINFSNSSYENKKNIIVVSFLNSFLKKLIKKGLFFVSKKIIYNFMCIGAIKESLFPQFLEKVIQKNRIPVTVINYSMRGKKFLVPSLSSLEASRINFIKRFLVTAKQNTMSSKKQDYLSNSLFLELKNLNECKGSLFTEIQSNYTDMRSMIHIGKKLFSKQTMKRKTNAAMPKKKFFSYI